jgi:hypothetical protein
MLWPLSASGDGGYPFGAFIVCRSSGGVMAALCDLPHPFALPVGLHVLGFAAAMVVTARLSGHVLRRWRPRANVIPVAALAVRLPGAIPTRPKRSVRRLRSVKPRKHFGLRGMPR